MPPVRERDMTALSLFADEMKAAPEQRGWSQADRADQIPYSLSAISMAEALHRVPGRDPVQRLRHADRGQAVGDLVRPVGLGPAALLGGRLHLVGEQRQCRHVALTHGWHLLTSPHAGSRGSYERGGALTTACGLLRTVRRRGDACQARPGTWDMHLRARPGGGTMPDIAEMDSYGMLCEDWGGAYLITRPPEAVHPYRAERRHDPAVVLAAAAPGALRELILADYC